MCDILTKMPGIAINVNVEFNALLPTITFIVTCVTQSFVYNDRLITKLSPTHYIVLDTGDIHSVRIAGTCGANR